MREILDKIPKTPGVYLMKDQLGKVIYIGKAKVLKDRVSSYFRKSATHTPKIELLVKQIVDIDYLETPSEVDALILESRLIKDIQPKYNTRQKDSKSYPYILISKERFPRVIIGREHEYSHKEYKFYGPFVDGYGLKTCFKLLQKIFKFRTCDLDIKEENQKYFRPCLLAHIKYCSAPCIGRVEVKSYKKEIQAFERFLQGQRQKVLKKLQKEMKEAAENWEYEQAAYIRDQIKGIESLDKQGLVGDFIPGQFLHINPLEGLKMLGEALEMKKAPRIIEGIDIAHHGGEEAVGSLVCFVDGIPYKEGYRRYRIKIPSYCNDYQMLREVFRRRFLGQDKDRAIPDVFLVDGGKGQLSSIVAEMMERDIEAPMIISLAKKNEEIYLPGRKTPLDIPKNSMIHNLVCYVRDEAHRFAQGYHHHLKRKRLKPKK